MWADTGRVGLALLGLASGPDRSIVWMKSDHYNLDYDNRGYAICRLRGRIRTLNKVGCISLFGENLIYVVFVEVKLTCSFMMEV